MARNRLGGAHRLMVVVTAMFVLSSCPANTTDEPDARTALAFIAVISNLASQVTLDVGDSEDLPTLFVESFDVEGIPLEVQVDVVTHFVEDYDVRFIDDRNEAIDIEVAGLPVRPASLLVGLGPLVRDDEATDDMVSVRGELYFHESDIRAYRFNLSQIPEDSWSILEPAEPIDPEGFGTVQ